MSGPTMVLRSFRFVGVGLACALAGWGELAASMGNDRPVLTPTVASPMPHPDFLWSATGEATAYEIELARDAAFHTDVRRERTDSPRFVPLTPLVPGTHLWRVRTRDAAGKTGAWSELGTHDVLAVSHRYEIPARATLEQIRQMIAEAAAHAPAEVTFARGATYRVKPTDQVFRLEKAHDLIIDGQGATIVIEEPTAGLSRLEACERITVRNLTVDYDPLPHSVGRVEAIDRVGAQAVLTLRPEPGYPMFDAPHMLKTWAFGVLLDTAPGHRGWMKPNAGLVLNFDGKKVSRVAGSADLFHVPLTSASTAAQFAVGDRAIIFARNGTRNLLQANQCNDVTYVGLVAYACPDLHVAYIYGSDLKVLGCEWKKKDDTRWFAGNADGVHVRANALGPWIEGCRMGSIGDDGIALYNKGISVVAQLAPDRVRVLPTYMDLGPGDRFRVYNPREGELGETEFTVRAVEKAGADWIVSFAPALPAAVTWYFDLTKPDQCDQLFNRSRRNGGFVIRNNVFEGIRRFGTVFRSVDGVLRGNTYRGTSNAAIAALNEPTVWQNGLESERVRILSNTIDACVFDGSAANVGSINIVIRKLGGVSSRPLHQYFLIADNTVIDWNQRAISLQNAAHSEVRGNVIRSTRADFAVPREGNRAIYLSHTEDCVVTGNNLSGERRPLVEAITVEESLRANVRDNQLASP